jgi:hypothetical protein
MDLFREFVGAAGEGGGVFLAMGVAPRPLLNDAEVITYLVARRQL